MFIYTVEILHLKYTFKHKSNYYIYILNNVISIGRKFNLIQASKGALVTKGLTT